MFRGDILTIPVSINPGRTTRRGAAETQGRRQQVHGSGEKRIVPTGAASLVVRRPVQTPGFGDPRPSARSRVDRASATASSATRTDSGAICVNSQPAAAAPQAMPMVVGSVTIAIAVSKDWPVFHSVITGCTQPGQPAGQHGSRDRASGLMIQSERDQPWGEQTCGNGSDPRCDGCQDAARETRQPNHRPAASRSFCGRFLREPLFCRWFLDRSGHSFSPQRPESE